MYVFMICDYVCVSLFVLIAIVIWFLLLNLQSVDCMDARWNRFVFSIDLYRCAWFRIVLYMIRRSKNVKYARMVKRRQNKQINVGNDIKNDCKIDCIASMHVC